LRPVRALATTTAAATCELDAGLFQFEREFLAAFEVLEAAATDPVVAVEKQAGSGLREIEKKQEWL
jgi:hypothetical protein